MNHKQKMKNKLRRRRYAYLLTPAEKRISNARKAIEGMPEDPRLIQATVYLDLAIELVSDYVDEQPL